MPTPAFRSIHCKARFAFPDQKIDLSAGELMALDHGIHHDVEALGERVSDHHFLAGRHNGRETQPVNKVRRS